MRFRISNCENKRQEKRRWGKTDKISNLEKRRQKSQLQNYYYHVVPVKTGTQKSLYLLDSRLRGNDSPRVLQLFQKKRYYGRGTEVAEFIDIISNREKAIGDKSILQENIRKS